LEFRFLEPNPEAVRGLGDCVQGRYDDPAAAARFAKGLDLCTFEFENVSAAAVRRLAGLVPVYPSPTALEIAQDRLQEKRFFQGLGIPTAPFAPVDDPDSLRDAVARIGLPAVLKTRRMGYDGKGQWLLRDPGDVSFPGEPCILESLVPFRRECSVVAARGQDGQVACYPLIRTVHRDGILRTAEAPCDGPNAEPLVMRVLEALQYVGVLALELFDVEGELWANEMAPRVHNSAHWTLEGSRTSQFENHLRALLGWPLGDPSLRAPAVMFNLIGRLPDPRQLLEIPDLHLHVYGKSPRPGRKLGHATLLSPDPDRLERARSRIEEDSCVKV
ncbi:MAG: 5-(carboxyamino)imidazole ribonucleotide synthase, partial [Candidatus Eremiobacterota bacterium]